MSGIDFDQWTTNIAALNIYQRGRWFVACCIMLGEMLDGGLIRVRVSGLTMGIGLRDRIADGWCSLRLFMAKAVGGETYAAPGRFNVGAR